MVIWPHGRGPITGYCVICGGEVKTLWSCRVAKESYCTGCGIINGPKKWRVIDDRERVRIIVNQVYDVLSKSEGRKIRLQPFLRTVNKLTLNKCHNWLPNLSKKEFEQWGYVVTDNTIEKVEST